MLDQVDEFGNSTPAPGFDPSNPPLADVTSNTYEASIPVNQALSPGLYRIVLVCPTEISNLYGPWTENQPLADFTVGQPDPPVVVPPDPPLVVPPDPPVVVPPDPPVVVVPPGATLSDATNLGTLGPQVQTVSGKLDFSGGQNNVALYKVTLGPGRYTWRLGLELDAQQKGSGFAVSLFDGSGNVLTTRYAGAGLKSSPNNPFLFMGLPLGVYYIGVSGAGNLPVQPDNPGGYNPVDGTVGTGRTTLPGGDFQLNLVADIADTPTKVTGFALNWQDPLSPTPDRLHHLLFRADRSEHPAGMDGRGHGTSSG